MRATSLCLLSLGLITHLQATTSNPKRVIGDHPNCGIITPENQRVARSTNFHDPGYVSVNQGHKRDESQVHVRSVRTLPIKYKPKLYRVPRDVPPHEGEEVPPQLPLQLSQGHGKEQHRPVLHQEAFEKFQDKEESEEEVEHDAEDLGKVIPATPLFVNARYQLRSRKVPQGHSSLQHPVDPRLYQQLQQNGMILASPLNRAQLFQRIHRDNRNIDLGEESTTAVNEDTCPDGEDPEAGGAQEGLAHASYNQTGLLSKPNSMQEVHNVNLSKAQNYVVNLPNDNLYAPNLSALPTSKRISVPSLQQIQPMQQHPGRQLARSQTLLQSQPTEGWQQPPVEEVSKTHEKK